MLSSRIVQANFRTGRLVRGRSRELQQSRLFAEMTTPIEIDRRPEKNTQVLDPYRRSASIKPAQSVLASGLLLKKTVKKHEPGRLDVKDRSYRVVFGSVYPRDSLHSDFPPRPIFNAKRGIYTRNGSEAVPMERQPSPGWVSTPLGAVPDESLGWLGSGTNLPGVVRRGGRGRGPRNNPDSRSK